VSIKTIVVTRPVAQARQLIEALNVKIGHLPDVQILSLPLLTIAPKEDIHLRLEVMDALADADLAIFVSPNAIECLMRLLERPWQSFGKKMIPIGVMGASSRVALEHHGVGLESSPTPILLPPSNENWDSQGLWAALQLLGWDWVKRKVVIFKGDGGRDWLADTLRAAGATVNAISVYARIPLDPESPVWNGVLSQDQADSLWLLTSSEAVRHLGEVMSTQDHRSLCCATALCPHRNIAESAKAIGFGTISTCQPGDEALMAAVQVWLAV